MPKRVAFVELVARRQHDKWREAMRLAGVSSRPDPDGVEQMCDWEELSPKTKARNLDFARSSVRTIADVMDDY
jgi:hypothetical protein